MFKFALATATLGKLALDAAGSSTGAAQLSSRDQIKAEVFHKIALSEQASREEAEPSIFGM
tara:strand:+ start:26 stop:208 length:183 start_codon:yes stop_codon:yes gene_type:complete